MLAVLSWLAARPASNLQKAIHLLIRRSKRLLQGSQREAYSGLLQGVRRMSSWTCHGSFDHCFGNGNSDTIWHRHVGSYARVMAAVVQREYVVRVQAMRLSAAWVRASLRLGSGHPSINKT